MTLCSPVWPSNEVTLRSDIITQGGFELGSPLVATDLGRGAMNKVKGNCLCAVALLRLGFWSWLRLSVPAPSGVA